MAKGRLSFYVDRCKACELCVYFCPKDTLGLDKNNINVLGYHPATAVNPDSCTGCGTCALMCPDLVIEVERSDGGMEKVLMKGNEALAEGALRAGCKAYFGYPITPSSEIAEYMARKYPKIGGVFLQAESEVAAINMVYGAASTGARVMTASSGPGISLKQEGISFIAEAELPCLIVNISRGGPGLGGIQPAQSDYFQATRGGGHGDYHTMVLAPASVQEMMDFAMEGFDLADKYRIPVMVMAEGTLGQMMEPIILRDPVTPDYEKPWATTGCKGRNPNIITTLHLPPEELEKRNRYLKSKYDLIKASEKRAETFMTEDADIVLVAFGLMSRVAKRAVIEVRKRGIKAGLIRPITLWPFPDEHIVEAAENGAKLFLSLEINMGQMIEDIKLALNGRSKVDFYGRIGIIPNPEEIIGVVMQIAEKGGAVMKVVAKRPESLYDKKFHYCPGCTHGIIHRILAECIDEMGLREKAIGICPVGCGVLAYEYFNCDMLEAAHGRAPAIATGIKRMLPENFVFTYQGDGDLASIGMAEIVHASARGENITVIFINNTIYGMTGGQMAPTTLIGQVTTTSPYGRKPEMAGYPIRMAELLATNEGSAYICRTSVHNPAHVTKTKKAIKKAIQTQMEGKGFTMVEILSTCPTNWGMNPIDALKRVETEMIPYFPLGEFKVKE